MKTGGLGLLAMRRVVSPIIDRVSTFVHRLYGRYPYRAVLAPMALDFPDRDPEPTILDRFPIHYHAPYLRCIEKEGHLFPDAPSTP